ncbi:site-determining protein [Xylanibacillus composti]|uniref:Site-determining protein n=1 Tax=Xylanibacillus composti TaxID=1572762 RepID=A0A8J4M189_9BACL|nr:MinD/ParA family protein [Xylanibacillus composti]GIQ68625.1 site-determining protein [Xylanibacillus composti]
MNDQAQGLRDLVQTREAGVRETRVITVTSGKGGVGKSNFTLNFAIGLQKRGYKVLVFDADIGLANIDVLMGVTPKYNLYHLLKREKTISEIIYNGYHGLQFIAGGSGFNDLIRLSDDEVQYFSKEVEQLNGQVDYILFDTGAGLTKETMAFILAAQETIVVTTPEPTSITDAYAIIKMVTNMNHRIDFKLVVNRSGDEREGKQTAEKITLVSQKFLNLPISTLGYVTDDALVSKSVKRQIPFTIAYPNCSASRSIDALVSRYLQEELRSRKAVAEGQGVKGFLSRMFRLVK